MMNVWTENVKDCSGTGLGVGGGVLTQPLIHIWENDIKKHRAGGHPKSKWRIKKKHHYWTEKQDLVQCLV